MKKITFFLLAGFIAVQSAAQDRNAEQRNLPTQTMLWSMPYHALVAQEVTLYAEVIGNGHLAPTGTVVFKRGGEPIGRAPVESVTKTNLLRYSSQFDRPVWVPLNSSGTLAPAYSISPLGDKTAYRYQHSDDNIGTYISQDVSGLSGRNPVTFSVWMKSNRGDNKDDVWIGIIDRDHHRRLDAPCMLMSGWQRCTATTPENPTSVTVFIGTDVPHWPWDASIWGAQLEQSPSAGAYVRSTDAPATATLGLATLVVSGYCFNSSPLTAHYGGDGDQLPPNLEVAQVVLDSTCELPPLCSGGLTTIGQCLIEHHVSLTKDGLLSAMHSKDRVIWTDAVAELGYEHVTDAIPEISAFLDAATNANDRIIIAGALAELGDDRGVQTLRRYCVDESVSLGDRLGAALSLLRYQPTCCSKTLIQGLQSGDFRLTALGMIWFFKELSPEESAQVRTLLLHALEDKDQTTRLAVAQAMYGLHDASLISPLQAALNKESVPFVRQAMEQSLKHLQTGQP